MDGAYIWRESRTSSPTSVPPKSPPDTSTGFVRHLSSSRDRLSYEEYGPRELKKLLRSATTQLEAEALRASQAERELQNLTIHLKRINDARLLALQDAIKAKEELKLYSAQLNAAQEEIYRAQDVLRVVDRQRYDAEKAAASSRSAVRRLKQEVLINAAREEGRRMGLQEGLERGRNIGIQDARFVMPFGGDGEDAESDGDDFPDYIDRHRSGSIISNDSPEPPPRNASPLRPPPPEPIPILPPETTNRVPDIRPISYRNASPSVQHSQISVPPDGYIPTLDADRLIRIPPPHELSKPPPTPERTQSHPLPESENPPQVNGLPSSNIPHRAHRAGHQSSSGTNSMALSQFDMLNDPDYGTGRRSPLSVIHEVLSAHTSPNPEPIGGHDLKHQSAYGGSSRRTVKATKNDFSRMARGSEAQQGVYKSPRTTSSTFNALDPPREHRYRSIASEYTVPDISIQPPSRPVSSRQESEASMADYHHLADADNGSSQPISVVLPDDPQGSVPTGGYSPAQSSDTALPIPPPFPVSREYYQKYPQTPRSGLDGPVIPDITLFGPGGPEDDVASSADTLTTPPPSAPA